eukprot:SAG11_NODE_783_length_7188_cov_2.206235_2_plen_84_part_00
MASVRHATHWRDMIVTIICIESPNDLQNHLLVDLLDMYRGAAVAVHDYMYRYGYSAVYTGYPPYRYWVARISSVFSNYCLLES